MLIVPLTKRKKLKTMKKMNSSSSPSSSGNESDVSLERTKFEKPDSENYDDWVFSSCKGVVESHNEREMVTLCVISLYLKRYFSLVNVVFRFFAMTYMYSNSFLNTLFVCSTAMPWFGMDIGGTLTKLVYFEPNEDEPEGDQEAKIIQKIRHYLTKNAAYGETGHRDIHLQVSKNPSRLNV